MKRVFLRAGRLWCAGLLLLGLRLAEFRTGFDPATGLSLPGLPGRLTAIVMAALALGELAACLRLPGEKAAYGALFAPPDRETPALVAGSLLLAAGGALLAFQAVPARNYAALAAGALAAASGMCLVLLTKRLREGAQVTVAPLLPAMFFGVFFVLAVYLPTENDPVLERYYMRVLAASLAACSFAMLAGFLRRESRPRTFVLTADLAVPACMAAMASGSAGERVLFGGCAAVLSVFLVLRRDGAETAPEAPAEEG